MLARKTILVALVMIVTMGATAQAYFFSPIFQIALPDLVVQEIRLEQDTPTGKTLVYLRVKNTGIGTASGYARHFVRFTLPGGSVRQHHRTVSLHLTSGSSTEVLVAATDGTFSRVSVSGWVDIPFTGCAHGAYGNILESTETNNAGHAGFTYRYLGSGIGVYDRDWMF